MIDEALGTMGIETRADLLRYVRRLANKWGLSESEVDAEGVVQDTYEQMIRCCDRIEDPSAWLHEVARRHVVRIVAARRRHRDGGDLDQYVEYKAGDVLWASLAQRPDLDVVMAVRMVLSAIAVLPGRQKIATYLHHVEGWSHAEIAERLRCATATAGVHVHRGTHAVAAAVLPLPQDQDSAESKQASTRSVVGPIIVLLGGGGGASANWHASVRTSLHWHPPMPILVGVLMGILVGLLVLGLWKWINRRLLHRTSVVPSTERALPGRSDQG